MQITGLVKHKDIFVNPAYLEDLRHMRVDNVKDAILYKFGHEMYKDTLSEDRQRLKFSLSVSRATVFMKKYHKPSLKKQIKNWIDHGMIKPTAYFDIANVEELNAVGIATPETVAFGFRNNGLFEMQSFSISKQVENSLSLEQRIPEFADRKEKVEFIISLAEFARKFHNTGFRHRDFYLCHIFYEEQKKKFTLIDLQRTFKPKFWVRRFLVKDLAQLYYSAPGQVFSKADRMRFYKAYKKINKLSSADKSLISAVNRKARSMAKHDIKHGRKAGYSV